MEDYKHIKQKKAYQKLLKSGMFWEFHPELSGQWKKDKKYLENIKKEIMIETFIDRIKKEREELNQKITKLGAFLDSEKVEELDSKDEDLLQDQLSIMLDYVEILDIRLARLEN